MKAYRGKKSFTLIELLVVMVVIGILAAILLPSLHQARERARRVSCLSNVRQIGTGSYMYADIYDGYFPRVESDYPDILDLGSARGMSREIGYPGENRLWACPSAYRGAEGFSDGVYNLFGMLSGVGYANYAFFTNWKGYSCYDDQSTSGKSPSQTTDRGPIVGDSVNNWTGHANKTTQGSEVNGAHLDSEGELAGMNILFTDMHGKWFKRSAFIEDGPQWKDSSGIEFYWVEEDE